MSGSGASNGDVPGPELAPDSAKETAAPAGDSDGETGNGSSVRLACLWPIPSPLPIALPAHTRCAAKVYMYMYKYMYMYIYMY